MSAVLIQMIEPAILNAIALPILRPIGILLTLTTLPVTGPLNQFLNQILNPAAPAPAAPGGNGRSYTNADNSSYFSWKWFNEVSFLRFQFKLTSLIILLEYC